MANLFSTCLLLQTVNFLQTVPIVSIKHFFYSQPFKFEMEYLYRCCKRNGIYHKATVCDKQLVQRILVFTRAVTHLSFISFFQNDLLQLFLLRRCLWSMRNTATNTKTSLNDLMSQRASLLWKWLQFWTNWPILMAGEPYELS